MDFEYLKEIASSLFHRAEEAPALSAASVALLPVVLWLASKVYNRALGRTIADIPGPPSPSFWMGNLGQLMRGRPGLWDLPWQDQFGYAFRFKGPVGEDRLWLSDPKALQYILQKSSYRFIKPHEARWQLATASGNGLNSTEGPDHARQRRVLFPAFGGPESRALLPFFRDAIQELVSQWKEDLVTQKDHTVIRDIPSTLGRSTLDALGHAAFEYDFGSMQNRENELTDSLLSFGSVGFARASDAKIFSQGMMSWVPFWVLNLALYFPSEGLRFLKKHVDLCNSVAHTLISSKSKSLEAGHVKKDVLSLIVQSNSSVEQKYRLTPSEIIPQLSTILVAGHETTTSTIGWVLFALCNNPSIQHKLRDELLQHKAKMAGSPSVAQLDAMPYLNAVIKETLRFETVVPHMFREATRDDVVPLSKPITTLSGKVIHEIFVPKGTRLIISTIGFHRQKEIWGEDADVFRPERWLDGTIKKPAASVGVTSSLMSFGSGHRGCIGWRFAYVEIQAFIYELITSLDFAHSTKSIKICRENNLAVRSMVDGEYEKGNQMPLKISLLQDE